MNDIRKAKTLYTQKRDIMKGLTELYAEKVPLWHQADRQARTKKPGKEIECVYRQKPQKCECGVTAGCISSLIVGKSTVSIACV